MTAENKLLPWQRAVSVLLFGALLATYRQGIDFLPVPLVILVVSTYLAEKQAALYKPPRVRRRWRGDT